MTKKRSVDIRDKVIHQGIANDAAWVGRLAADFENNELDECIGVASFCVMPYIALFVHESYAKLASIDPALAGLLSGDFQAIVARSRHSLKLFEDTKRRIPGQLEYFRDEIFTAHANYFTGNVSSDFRHLETDLGLFFYASRLVSTSHVANFHLGISPRETLAMTGQEMMNFSEQYGRYFGYLGAQVPVEGGATFFSRMDPRKMGEVGNDVHSTAYYANVFDSPENLDLNALLTVFRCMVNFASTALSSSGSEGVVDYTEFKIKFLTVYQVLASLEVLRSDSEYSLTSRSDRALQGILDAPAARAVMDRSARPFRNTLMHYNLDRRLDLSKVDLASPVFNLASAYYPDCRDFGDLVDMIEMVLVQTSAAIDDWAES
ncbi:hypothetical protein SGR_3844 [Streptomyces griseus subsp. griseus NBRC 13350]|uniref:Uncharacterized protein n=1 Tax=Streptomyces griseus subsp. griseus (strain JCM 4626 / CBS 651.72 / NBRC 13350 / KCC S-0626 / ISP 5235) TaxID=455632 RepID=B1VR22_STRGG|nr:hypothetical protein SGR_3844 [Streptomyces griseus subsp. griseus NBRC 13350]SEE76328.1 hypothetical protein SAMN04490359_5673 [Streptomyces griseus]SQA20451.1 Uncharacterised protein [Streptomyces griseus]